MFRQRPIIVRLACGAALFALLPGCEIGRTWASMSSDSPMPFLGFDLLPRRKTSQLETPPDRAMPVEKELSPRSGASRPQARPVADHALADQRSSRELRLPSLSELLTGEKVESLSFTGPEPAFSR